MKPQRPPNDNDAFAHTLDGLLEQWNGPWTRANLCLQFLAAF